MNPLRSKRLLGNLRRGCLLLGVLGALYLWQRYELLPLPRTGCSPLMSLSPGSTLWVDLQAEDLGVGDVIFFSLPSGAIAFGRCTRTQGTDLWLVTDVEACPAEDSQTLGWIAQDRVHGRLVLAFGTF